jgi:hypothetical protein
VAVSSLIGFLIWCVLAELTQDSAINSIVKETAFRDKQQQQCAFLASTYSLEDVDVENIANLNGEKKLIKRVKVVRDGDIAIVEYIGELPGAELSPRNPLNEVTSVYAFSGSVYYEYLPIPSTGNPLANVNRYAKTDPRARMHIDELLLSVDSSVLFGQKIDAFLTDPNLRLTTASESEFTLQSKGENLGVTYQTVLTFNVSARPELVSASIESVSNGVKTKMERRITYQDFEGKRLPKKMVTFMGGTMSKLEFTEITFLPFEKPGKVDDEYFQRYKRLYSVSNFGQQVDKTVDATPIELKATYADRMMERMPNRGSYYIGAVVLFLIAALGSFFFFVRRKYS